MESELKELIGEIEDVLRCPICLEKLRPPVVLCENGHGTCSKCRADLNACSICSASYSSESNDLSMRMLERVLELLPEPCPHAKRGCSAMDLPSHSQYCGYRPIRCVVGSDYSCSWSGTVNDWIDHVQSAHHTHDHSSIKDYNCNINYGRFMSKDSWTFCGSVHCFDNNYFLVLCTKKNEKLYETVRHVSLGKTNSQYFLETTIRNHSKKDVLYRVVLTTGLLSEDDLFENNATSFTFEDLNKFAVSEGSLKMSCKFTKQ